MQTENWSRSVDFIVFMNRGTRKMRKHALAVRSIWIWPGNTATKYLLLQQLTMRWLLIFSCQAESSQPTKNQAFATFSFPVWRNNCIKIAFPVPRRYAEHPPT
jgi:hypothetical protein